MVDYTIAMEGVSKSFGDVAANQEVSLHIKEGEIRSLLGENGAGKSTLMKILYGLYTRDSGDVIINGVKMPDQYTPHEAIENGISMVSQHFMLIDAFSVAENIVLGKEGSKVQYSKKSAEQTVQKLCDKYHINLSPHRVVGTLSLGEKQKTEILKALYRKSKVLILDEPTAVLTPQEIDDLFAMLKSMREEGMTIVLITHKLEEVMEISDYITVMRQGKKVCTIPAVETDIKELAGLMIGRELQDIHVSEKPIQKDDKPVLSLKNLCTSAIGERCSLKGFTLDLYAGRIIGLAGIDGNGQTDLLEILAGFRDFTGEIHSQEETLTSNSVKLIEKLGVAMIPEDRHEQGLILPFTVSDNLIMRKRHDERFFRKGIRQTREIEKNCSKLIDDFDIRPKNGNLRVELLSGGNQQKVILARELSRDNLKVLVASQPTRGLDVGAIEFVHQTLLALREQGKAVLLISSDLDEIRELSDYIAVIHDGRIVLNELSSLLSVEQIGMAMGGVVNKEEDAQNE